MNADDAMDMFSLLTPSCRKERYCLLHDSCVYISNELMQLLSSDLNG